MNGLDLKLARVRAGLTLWQLGRLAGVHPARISEMERDQRPITEAVIAALKEVSDGVLNVGKAEDVSV